MNQSASKLSIEDQIVMQWRLKIPKLKAFPNRIAFPQLLARFNPGKPTPITAVIMSLSQAYFEHGCHIEMCDYAACRDLWEEINRRKRPESIST